jgi:clan AA aspartic protease
VNLISIFGSLLNHFLKEFMMGLTVLEIEVGNPANPEVTEKIEFLIDSGAIYSVVPAPILERLSIKPLAEQEFRLANGDKIVRRKGGALFKYGERIGVADVIFGEEGDSVLLGAFTLEALGLSLDPLRRELKPLPMMIAVLLRKG